MTNRLSSGLVSAVQTADSPILIVPSANHGGGVIYNPISLVDQGTDAAEPLYVSLLGPASVEADATTVALLPGQSFLVPPGASAWVNAATAGHQFSSVFLVAPSPPPQPQPVPGAPGFGAPGPVFPPYGPTGLIQAIKAYLYQQYSDDDDLQTFVEALNEAQQNYVDTFNALELPIYIGWTGTISGSLLDWVGNGVYGYPRPVLSSGRASLIGPLNTWGPNSWGTFPPQVRTVLVGGPLLNGLTQVGPNDIVVADDDTYRRCLTWHYHKGDGRYFDVRWLKRRVMRFLYGVDGTSPPIDQTNQISVSFGPDYNVSIRFVLGQRTIVGGALPNRFGPNGFGHPYHANGRPSVDVQMNDLRTTYVAYPSLPYMAIFKEALESGVLETPFQFNVTCAIG